MNTYIDQTIDFVKRELENAESGHDWFHIERVYKVSLKIAQAENDADLLVVKLIALLHDIADSKFHNGDESVGPNKAREWMLSLGIDNQIIDHVVLGIQNISFKGGNFEKKFTSKELQIVQDADRLDAIGAIGIARTFNYGGYTNAIIHDPNCAPKMNMTKEEYKSQKGTTINHFYEKLLLLKDLMNTVEGKRLAQERHDFMELYLAHFYAEWEGEA